ncbi:MAG: hypothetical protein ACK5QX_00945 [bacterium]|jgi:hypothetical protein
MLILPKFHSRFGDKGFARTLGRLIRFYFWPVAFFVISLVCRFQTNHHAAFIFSVATLGVVIVLCVLSGFVAKLSESSNEQVDAFWAFLSHTAKGISVGFSLSVLSFILCVASVVIYNTQVNDLVSITLSSLIVANLVVMGSIVKETFEDIVLAFREQK